MNTAGTIFILLIFIALGVITWLIFRARFRKQREQLAKVSSSSNGKSRSSSWKWSYSKEDLENQISNYNNLGFTKSARGISVLLILIALGITLILYFFNLVESYSLIAGFVIYLPLAYFIYKGHRWAVIAVMIMWTLDKAFSVYALGQQLADQHNTSGGSFLDYFFMVVWLHVRFL